MSKDLENTSIVGLVWGDEGKGRIIDFLVWLMGYRTVVRHNGGNNAGHSIYVNDKLVHLHFIPSGIVHPDGTALMGVGELLEPFAFMNERLYLSAVAGIDPTNRIFMHPQMNLILLYHRIEDMVREVARKGTSDGEIGTTAKGVGPAMADLAQRPGIRLHHLLGDPKIFEEMFRAKLEEKLSLFVNILGLDKDQLDKDEIKKKLKGILNGILEQLKEKDLESCKEVIAAGALDSKILDYSRYYDDDAGLNADAMLNDYFEIAERIKAMNCLRNIGLEVIKRRVAGEGILFEGGQGSLLDVLLGSYPFVTSTHPIAGSACIGTPVGPTFIERVIGVVKLFTTRVGDGPLPTEDEKFGKLIRGTVGSPGAEYGTTTGRPRRLGWPDTVIPRTTAMWSGVDQLAGIKLDFLDPLKEVRVCTQYRLDGEMLDLMPMDPADLARVEPVYEVLPGWREDTTKARKWSDLPLNARRFADRYLELCQPPIDGAPPITWHSIGIGPNRDQLIVIDN